MQMIADHLLRQIAPEKSAVILLPKVTESNLEKINM